MKAKKFIIRLQTPKETLDEFEKTWKILASPKNSKKVQQGEDVVLYFSDMSMVAKVLSHGRLEIIRAIQEHKPRSINKLAKLLNRSQPNVHKDVHYLAQLGIIELKIRKTTASNKSKVVEPVFNYSGFEIDLAA